MGVPAEHRRSAVVRAAAVLVAAVAADAATAEEPRKEPTLRSDLGALLAWIPARDGGEESREGPSPTALTARLVAAGDAKLRPELTLLWKLATTERSDASRRIGAIEQTVRFLYGTGDASKAALRVVEGAVVPFVPPQEDYDFGSFDAPRERPATPKFADLVKGGRLRAAPKPQAAKLLAALRAAEFSKWESHAQLAVARAAGEVSVGDAAAKLIALAEEDPTDAALSSALATCAVPAAETALRKRVATLAPRVAAGKTAAQPLLEAAARALAARSATAFDAVLADLPEDAQAAAVAAAGPDLGVRLALALADTAAPDARVRALSMLRHAVTAESRTFPVRDGARLVQFLRAAAEDGPSRAEALACAETLLYAYNRYPVTGSSSSNGNEEETKGESVGPYPGIAEVLADLDEGLRAGAVRFREPADALWEEPVAAVPGETTGARTKVPNPYPMRPAVDDPPVGLAGEVTAEGLRLTLTNRSKAAFALAAPSLRWARGEIVRSRVRADGGAPREFTCLRLALGFLRAPVAVASERLVVLAPGASHTWTVGLRESERSVDHIAVELVGRTDVVGRSAAPLLDSIDESFVK